MLSPAQFAHIASAVQQPDSGGTWNYRTGERVTSGWAVAGAGDEHAAPASEVTGPSVQQYAEEHDAGLRNSDHLGMWHDPADHTVYHDASHILSNTASGGAGAIAAGYANRQISVYHLDRGNTVYMHPQTRKQRRDTRKGINDLTEQRGGRGPSISEMPTADLAAALRGRKTVSDRRRASGGR